MSDIKLNIQLFGGGGSSEWTAGITESAVNEAFDQFVAQIEKTKETIRDYAKVDEALTAGWRCL